MKRSEKISEDRFLSFLPVLAWPQRRTAQFKLIQITGILLNKGRPGPLLNGYGFSRDLEHIESHGVSLKGAI